MGAGLTAFYIFRAAGFVFFGETNLPQEKYRKVAESPMSMALPLLLLATLSLIGGFVGVPEALGGHDPFVHWLGSIIPYEVGHAPSAGTNTEIILMVITLLWGAHFSILGLLVYAQKRDWPVRVAGRVAFLHSLVYNLYYVDQIYNWLIVKPIVWLSRNVLWRVLDATFVDGIAVYGTARAIGFMGTIASAAETGVLQRYLLYFLIGAVVIIGFMAL